VRLGDAFGMYGFSGASRSDVRFVVIKDIRESLNQEVIGRLDSFKPMHTTRMGAAIRHAMTKLKGQQAGTRLLIVISDGRPFDVDYGQQYGKGAENDYAIHDTRKALDEARAHGIRPFLLTVDSEGGDYLRTMCRDLDYEVLSDVTELPERLATLYRQLTAHAKSAT
jgi:nitric oxide reductase activation protein